MIRIATFALFGLLAAPLAAKDSLGVYSNWAAFRDAETPRCYAIAKPRGSNANSAFASVATWPRQGIRNQVHFRLSRAVGNGGTVRLRIGTKNFELTARGRDAWAKDRRDDAAIVAALRSAETSPEWQPRWTPRSSDAQNSSRLVKPRAPHYMRAQSWQIRP